MEKEMYIKPSAEVVMYDSSDIIATRSGDDDTGYICIFTTHGQGIICPLWKIGLASPDNGDSSFG